MNYLLLTVASLSFLVTLVQWNCPAFQDLKGLIRKSIHLISIVGLVIYNLILIVY